MEFNNYDKNMLKYIFDEFGYEIIDMENCIRYLKKSFCLFTYEEIINRFCEQNEIKCPMRYLDDKMIYSRIQFDYYEINNDLFLDIEIVFEDISFIEEMLKKGLIEE